jgi:hypothetical protein
MILSHDEKEGGGGTPQQNVDKKDKIIYWFRIKTKT